jgi:hypothetical protein
LQLLQTYTNRNHVIQKIQQNMATYCCHSSFVPAPSGRR